MEISGAKFNFNKHVSEDGRTSVNDGAKLETKIAGEKTDGQNTKDMINLSMVTQILKTAVNGTIQNIEGAQLSEQVRALQTIGSTVISSVFMAATNPYALITTLACKSISYVYNQDKINRQRAWDEYDVEEYNLRRGYSSSRTRSI